MEKLKIFIYNLDGEKIKEYFYSDFIYAFNEVLAYNFKEEENKWNLIIDFNFPPVGLKWNDQDKNWEKDLKTKYLNKNIDLTRFFDVNKKNIQ